MGKEDAGDSNDGQRRELEVGTSRALTNPGGKDFPPLSEMISRSLANIVASNQLITLHRVGDHELHDPDYRQICAWAEETGWSNEEVLNYLLEKGAEVSGGRFVKLILRRLFISIPQIEGLKVRILDCSQINLTELDLTPVPNLEQLFCHNNSLTELDLTPVPNLEELKCFNNNLTELDLNLVPKLEKLTCGNNKLTELDLTPVPNLVSLACHNSPTELDLNPVPKLKGLYCSGNSLTELDLNPVPKLKRLDCSENNLTELDLTPVSKLEYLRCIENDLTELDLTPVPKLEKLYCCIDELTELDLKPVPNLKFLNYECLDHEWLNDQIFGKPKV